MVEKFHAGTWYDTWHKEMRKMQETVESVQRTQDYIEENLDGYQRAFQREFGCNPREYAAHPVSLYLFTPYGVKYRVVDKEKRMEHVKSVFVQLEPIGTRGYIELLVVSKIR